MIKIVNKKLLEVLNKKPYDCGSWDDSKLKKIRRKLLSFHRRSEREYPMSEWLSHDQADIGPHIMYVMWSHDLAEEIDRELMERGYSTDEYLI